MAALAREVNQPPSPRARGVGLRDGGAHPTSRLLDLRLLKSVASQALAPGQPGRELILGLDDLLPESEFNALVPSIVRLVRIRQYG